MFRPVSMVHLQVQIPGRDGPAVTRRIAAQGLLHLIDISHGRSDARTPSATRELLAEFRELSRRIRLLARTFDVALSGLSGELTAADVDDFAVEYADLRRQLDPIQAAVDALVGRMTDAGERRQRGRERLEHAQTLDLASIDTERLRNLRFTAVRIGAATLADLAALSDALTPDAFAILPLTSSARPLAAVAVPASRRDRLEAALRQTTFETFDVAAPAIDAPALRRSLEEAEAIETAARRELASLRDTFGATVQAFARRAEIAIVLLQAQTLFATTGRFLVISGWIPEAQAPELTAALARVTEGRAVVTVERPDAVRAASASALGIPILYRNPLLLRPFERLIDLYGVPSYAELQPTAFFAVSFLLMFGLMFGDVGHGSVLIAAGYCLFRYMPQYLDYGILLMETGIASAVFGVLYGSVFGVDHWIPALWLHPIRDIARFTRIAAALGIGMVSVGFVLGAINTWRSGDRAAALVGIRGLFGAFTYWTCIAVAARMFLPVEWTLPAGAVVGLCTVAAALLALRPAIVRLLGRPASRSGEHATPLWLHALEASVELVDTLVSYFANTVSFVRVAAFAAVHAAVLVAVFAMADTLARYRFGGWLSLVVLVGGNILTILLEGLTVTVQVLRLEYYEFFGKFFKGGGAPYRPLALRSGDAQGDT